MGDILKEAIADAKAVRETALENAKIALEEAFQPRIQSMLSAKLKEVEDEDEFGAEDEFGGEEIPGEEVPGEEEMEELGKIARDASSAEDQFGGEDEVPVDAAFGDEEQLGGEEEAEMEEEGVIEINGVKYAPVVAEDEFYEGQEEVNDTVEEEIDDLDLEAVIKELESELTEDDELDESDNPYDGNEQHNSWTHGESGSPKEIHKSERYSEGEEKDDDDKEEVEEGAGSVDQDSTKLGYDPTGAKKRNLDEPSQGSLKAEGDDKEGDIVEVEVDDDKEDVDEEYDKSTGVGNSDNSMDQVSTSAIGSGGETGVVKKKFSENIKSVKAELKEYKEAVKFLKDRLHEVNILNAKLLYTNKLFREFALDNGQKMKVVETFDRAQTVREIKLVYSTLGESFGGNSNISRKSIKESAGGSSKPTKSTKPQVKVISEEEETADRFRKLAGLLNG
jgi:hypothetical protein